MEAAFGRSDLYLIKGVFFNFAKVVHDHVYVYVVLFSIVQLFQSTWLSWYLAPARSLWKAISCCNSGRFIQVLSELVPNTKDVYSVLQCLSNLGLHLDFLCLLLEELIVGRSAGL